MINQSKTKIGLSILSDSIFNKPKNSQIEVTIQDSNFYQEFKSIIKIHITNNNITELKYLLTAILTQVEKQEVLPFEVGDVQNVINLLIQLVFVNENLVSRCYKLILAIAIRSADSKLIVVELKEKLEMVNSNYSETLIQIWHYYTILQLDTKNRNEYLRTLIQINGLSPIISLVFVEEGMHSNIELFNAIKQSYSNQHGTNWKESIYYSKWSLTLLSIYLKDGHNYCAFYKSGGFPSILRELRQ